MEFPPNIYFEVEFNALCDKKNIRHFIHWKMEKLKVINLLYPIYCSRPTEQWAIILFGKNTLTAK